MCEHGYNKTSVEAIENPYTGEVEEETTETWVSYFEYFTHKTDKCSKCGKVIYPEY